MVECMVDFRRFGLIVNSLGSTLTRKRRPASPEMFLRKPSAIVMFAVSVSSINILIGTAM